MRTRQDLWTVEWVGAPGRALVAHAFLPAPALQQLLSEAEGGGEGGEDSCWDRVADDAADAIDKVLRESEMRWSSVAVGGASSVAPVSPLLFASSETPRCRSALRAVARLFV